VALLAFAHSLPAGMATQRLLELPTESCLYFPAAHFPIVWHPSNPSRAADDIAEQAHFLELLHDTVEVVFVL